MWISSYTIYIFRANSIIEGVTRSSTIPNKQKQILIGEAKFIRAFAYFYLFNLFGDVPLVTSTDFNVNASIGKSSKAAIYDQIVKDLIDAQNLLTDNYLGVDLVTSTSERIRPNKAAATALLARVYLYMDRWADAEAEASKIISSTSQYQLVPVDKVFLMNSKEAIWQLQPNPLRDSGRQKNTLDGEHYLSTQIKASEFLLEAFEAQDLRRSNWIGDLLLDVIPTHYFRKYRVNSLVGNPETQQEYTMILRLAEQYLIRAEARAMQDKISGNNSANEDLNKIRERAGLGGINLSDRTSMLEAIYHERYVELFTELGHRWFDLKRSGKIDERMQVVSKAKGGIWHHDKALMPIPLSEFQRNPMLKGHQNPGYPEN